MKMYQEEGSGNSLIVKNMKVNSLVGNKFSKII
jgi:hypothetical protein